MIMMMTFDTPEEKNRFVELYGKYKFLMMKVAYDVLQDRFLAEDAVHSAFIKVSGKMAMLEDMGEPAIKKYLIVITKNTAIDIWRKRKKYREREMNLEDMKESEMPTAQMESSLDNGILDAFQKLPEIYKDVFLLKYASEFSNDRIADILEIPEGTVRQRIARGKVLLQRELDNMEDGQ